DIIKGKVVRILPFGAFVEIETGLDGLVHISRISNKRLKKVEEVLKIGQEIEAKILEVDEGNMRINLSIKAVNPIDPPETHEENKPGKVKTVENKTVAQTDEKKEENIEKPAAKQLAEEGRGEETQKVKETETEAKIPNFHKEELSNTIGDFLGDVDLSDFKEKKSDKDGE
ncbi:MAG: S1 RNA-binding domain-containing protein, partial [Eubacteriales bacterium]|nr:S1 RNA-binding domain-containing protein [Eubacteriales bacterium]